MYCNMIAILAIVSTSVVSHNYHFLNTILLMKQHSILFVIFYDFYFHY